MHPTRHLTHLTLGAFALAGLAAASPACSVPCEDTLTCPKPLQEGGGGSGAGHTGAAGPGGGAQGGGGNTFTDLGEPCTAPTACQSGHCVDGVCCEAACDGDCVTCAASGSEGTCTPHPAGEDPESDCGSGVCDGAGTCATGAHVWSAAFATNVEYSIPGRALAAHDGGVVFAGQNNAAVNFGGSSSTSPKGAFWVKFGSTGAHEWTSSLGGTNVEVSPVGMAIDPSGLVLAVGSFNGTLEFFGEPDVVSSSSDLVVMRLGGSGGTGTWTKFLNGPGGDGAVGIAAAGETVVVLGTVGSTISVDGINVTNSGGPHFAVGLDKEGDALWGKNLELGAVASIHGVVSGPAHALIVGGHANGAEIGGTVLDGSGTYLAALSPTGTFLWAKSIGSVNIEAHGAGPSGGIVVAGRFSGVVDFGTGPLSSSGEDGFVASFDADGVPLAAFAFPQPPDDLLGGIAADPAGNVAVSGRSFSAIDLGGGALTGSELDAFVGKFSATGVHLWSKRFAAVGNQSVFGVAGLSHGGVAITGDTFPGGLNVGGGALGSDGAFMAIFHP